MVNDSQLAKMKKKIDSLHVPTIELIVVKQLVSFQFYFKICNFCEYVKFGVDLYKPLVVLWIVNTVISFTKPSLHTHLSLNFSKTWNQFYMNCRNKSLMVQWFNGLFHPIITKFYNNKCNINHMREQMLDEDPAKQEAWSA